MESSLPLPIQTQVERLHLGMPGAWAVDRFEPSDNYTTKIGGIPDLPASLRNTFLSSDLIKCRVCNGMLTLVAQVYAPLAIQENYYEERSIYVFGCSGRGCGAESACWRTFRVQKSTLEPTMPETDAKSDVTKTGANELECCADQQVTQFSASGWNGCNSWEGETWDGESGVVQGGEDFLDLKELEASLIDAGRLAAENSRKGTVQRDRAGRRGDSNSTRKQRQSKRSLDSNLFNTEFQLPALPCFYIYFKIEDIKHKKSDVVSSTTSSSSSALPGESRESTTCTVAAEGDHAGEVWEEEYEPDRALHTGRTYLRFKKYLDHHRELCLRYSFEGRVLWGVDELGEVPGKCGACGAERVFEFQLMPPVLYFLHQAIASEQANGLPSLVDWNWFSLVVFSCSLSCSPLNSKEEWNIVEEGTVLQQE